MNFDKDPRHAHKLAKEQKHLRKVAKKNPNKLRGKERSLCEWEIELDNYQEPIHVEKGWNEDHYFDDEE